MATNTGHIMTLANSIIGVSILAMPYCFKQCGILLSIIMLVLSSIITRSACHFLLKSAVTSRRKNFEFLAFHALGSYGKLLVELGIIGFLMGTCIAFFVVMGDLGPELISKIFTIENNSTLRTSVLLGIGVFIILPLGLLRNVESLAAISTVTILFYLTLIIKLFFESTNSLVSGEWKKAVVYWRPEGILQCIPIFSMGLACQTQLFEIYETLPNASIDRMNQVVRYAVNICTVVYIFVGLLGYIAYSTQAFTGNILLSLSPGTASDVFKIGFILSLAVSFPVVIFPCRASLYSLMFKRVQISHHDLTTAAGTHIPDVRFKCLTLSIVTISMLTGLMIPSIEFVLGIVGSTIGVAICVIFPSLVFVKIFTKDTNERLFAKFLLLLGAVIVVLGTYANLNADYEPHDVKIIIPKMDLPPPPQSIPVKQDLPKLPEKKDVKVPGDSPPLNVSPQPILVQVEPKESQRKEPPVPIEPAEKVVKPSPAPVKLNEVVADVKSHEKIDKDAIEREEQELKQDEETKNKENDKKENELLKKLEEHKVEQKKLLEEQKEILKELKVKSPKENEERRQQEKLLEKLEEHKVEQKQLMEEQKQILKELKNKEVKDVEKIFKQVNKIDSNDKNNNNVIKPEKFNENIEKIQDVIDNLKDTNQEIKKEMLKEDKNKLLNVPLPLIMLKNISANGVNDKEVRVKRQVVDDETCSDNKTNVDLVQNINHLSVQNLVKTETLSENVKVPNEGDLQLVPKKRDLKSVKKGDKNK